MGDESETYRLCRQGYERCPGPDGDATCLICMKISAIEDLADDGEGSA
jgi:hypothetical protein